MNYSHCDPLDRLPRHLADQLRAEEDAEHRDWRKIHVDYTPRPIANQPTRVERRVFGVLLALYILGMVSLLTWGAWRLVEWLAACLPLGGLPLR